MVFLLLYTFFFLYDSRIFPKTVGQNYEDTGPRADDPASQKHTINVIRTYIIVLREWPRLQLTLVVYMYPHHIASINSCG